MNIRMGMGYSSTEIHHSSGSTVALAFAHSVFQVRVCLRLPRYACHGVNSGGEGSRRDLGRLATHGGAREKCHLFCLQRMEIFPHLIPL